MDNPFSLSSTQAPSKYYELLVAAFIRGKMSDENNSSSCFRKPLEDLIVEEKQELIQIGEEKELDLDFLVRKSPSSYQEKLFGVLRGVQPDQVLNIGKVSNDFIWHLVDEFHYLPVIALSADEVKVERIKNIYKGGFSTLNSKRNVPLPKLVGFPNNQFDVVTSTDGFEEEKELLLFLPEITRITKRFLILTFPDSFNENRIRGYLKDQNILQFRSEKAEGYTILIARK